MSIELISVIVYGILSTIANIIEIINNKKHKKTINELNNENKFNKILIDLPETIDKVENEVKGTKQGAIRKTLVMQNAQLECSTKNISFDLPKVNSQIEKIMKAPQATIYKKEQKEIEQEKNEINTQNW